MRKNVKGNDPLLFIGFIVTISLALILFVSEIEFDSFVIADTFDDFEDDSKVVEIVKPDSDINTDKQNAIDIIMQKAPIDYKTAEIILDYSKQFDLKPSIILSVIELESEFNQYDVGKDQDRGYMQIIPNTEKWLAEEFGDEIGVVYNPNRIFEPEYNIGIGVAYLSFLHDAYGEDYNRILSEYNRGPYNLKKYYSKYKTYETTYSRVVLSKENKYLACNVDF